MVQSPVSKGIAPRRILKSRRTIVKIVGPFTSILVKAMKCLRESWDWHTILRRLINTGIPAVQRRGWSRALRVGHIAAGTVGDAVVADTVEVVAAGTAAAAVAARAACAAAALPAAARGERPTDRQSRQRLNRLLQ